MALIGLVGVSSALVICLIRGGSKDLATCPVNGCTPNSLIVEEAQPNGEINVAVANPASANCLKLGGRLELQTENEGQIGICIFSDDTRCEEWSYFRGNCLPGQNIAVFSPAAGSEITLPFTFTGQARVFENSFLYRLKDKTGKIIASGTAYANSADMGQFGDFSITVAGLTARPADAAVRLEVYDASAKDGSEIDLVSVPLKLNLPPITNISLFFNNDQLDPEITCTKVFPVTRIIAKTEKVGQAALELLLAGPSAEEFAAGYRTSLNAGVKLNSLSISKGVAQADFDQALQAGVGGSCRVGAIGSQIKQTLLQFPTVKEVAISVDGQTEEVLQP